MLILNKTQKDLFWQRKKLSKKTRKMRRYLPMKKVSLLHTLIVAVTAFAMVAGFAATTMAAETYKDGKSAPFIAKTSEPGTLIASPALISAVGWPAGMETVAQFKKDSLSVIPANIIAHQYYITEGQSLVASSPVIRAPEISVGASDTVLEKGHLIGQTKMPAPLWKKMTAIAADFTAKTKTRPATYAGQFQKTPTGHYPMLV